MGSGVTVVIAHCLGAQKNELTKKNICSAFAACCMVGILICLISFFSTDIMLNVLNTKQELFQQAALYLKIFSLGFPAMALYNYGNGVLSACGETKRPLMYLTVAGIANVILN